MILFELTKTGIIITLAGEDREVELQIKAYKMDPGGMTMGGRIYSRYEVELSKWQAELFRRKFRLPMEVPSNRERWLEERERALETLAIGKERTGEDLQDQLNIRKMEARIEAEFGNREFIRKRENEDKARKETLDQCRSQLEARDSKLQEREETLRKEEIALTEGELHFWTLVKDTATHTP